MDIQFSDSSGTNFSGFPELVSVGTYVHESGLATITNTDIGTAPEPSSLTAVLIGGLGVLVSRIKRKRRARRPRQSSVAELLSGGAQ